MSMTASLRRQVAGRMSDFIDQLEIQIGDPSEQTSDYEWICKNCRINGRPYSSKNHEYQEVILKSTARKLRVKKCAQIGVSVISILRCFAKLGRYRGFTILYILPSATFSQSFNATRITPLLQECKQLRDIQDKTVDSTSVKKFGANNFLHNKGAVSKAAAISVDADYLVKDEVDFMTDHTVLTSFASRLLHSPYKFDAEFSTPTIPDFGISKSFNESKRHLHMAKCVHCGWWFQPQFDMIVFPGVGKGQELKELTKYQIIQNDINSAYLECPHCGVPTDESLQHEHREFVIENPTDNFTEVGYHIQPFSVPNIQPVPNILLERPNYARWVDYSNNVLGEDDADASDSFTREEIETFFDSTIPAEDDRTGFFGIDVGLTFHYMVIKESSDGVIYIPDFGTIPLQKIEKELHNVKQRHRVRVSAIDLYPYVDTVLRLQETDPMLWGCEFTESRGIDLLSIKTRDEESEKATDRMQIAQVRRDRVFDTILSMARAGNLRIRPTDDKELLIDHMLSVKRLSTFDKNEGKVRFKWVKTDGKDHFFFSMLYGMVAFRLREVVGNISLAALPFLATSFKTKH